MSLFSQAVRRAAINQAPRGTKGAVKKFFANVDKISTKINSLQLTDAQRAELEKILAMLESALVTLIGGLVAGGLPK